MSRARSDPVHGDVVRARLQALVAELTSQEAAEPEPEAPRRAVADVQPGEDAGAGADGLVRGVVARAWRFGRSHAAVVGVVGLIALVGSVFALFQARTVPVANAVPSAVVPSRAPTPTPTPDPEPLRVHVLGAVGSPGVVRLLPGARVEDALAAAGGLTKDARPGDLNLAAPVSDGQQVRVGNVAQPGGEVRSGEGDGAAPGAGSAASGQAGGRLDLNRATAEQLDALPGVGPVTAQAILTWRSKHQKFSRVEELQEVDGIGPKTFAQIEPHVRV